MKFMSKLERKYGRYAIRNLSSYIIAMYVVGYLFTLFAPGILMQLSLEPAYILKGQVWRLVSWLLVPPSASPDIFTVIMLFFYYSVGKALENNWGAFRYNVYIFSGMIFTVIGAFVLHFALGQPAHFWTYNLISGIFSTPFSTYYINMSIFLAFAASFPNAEVLLYFFIPVKIKWLGVIYGVMLAVEFVSGSLVTKVVIVASLLNFILFFFSTRNMQRYSPKEQKRRNDFKKMSRPTGGERRSGANGQITRHKCAVCGRTELDGDNLEFRFCSKCAGNYEYCQDHLFTHEHVYAGEK
ncbi:MAG: hypothetical protein Q4B01_05015 [Eubacteriales bacterium]|nr:hypothetical protein [Eubacteriales bacterium]